MDDRTNERFGRYEILSELGRGAMGVVYKAHDPRINRTVAVKTISLAGQPPEDELDFRERFRREAEAAGRVSHPGIVTIFDVGEEPETRAPYIVMEFVNGESLDKLLLKNDDRKLPVETALRLALELGEALDCAHRQGVVHRDLKPANILVTEDGHAKIADFGVAKLNLSNQTLGGRTLGTPAYMSPEQLNGEAVDGRSDLFSLGVILYTVLTGHRPFQGNSAVTVSFKVVNHEPMPATLFDTALPESLDAIIARAMAKDPADRYQSGMEMVSDLRKLLEEEEPGSKSKHASSPVVASANQAAAEDNPSPAMPARGDQTSAQATPTQAMPVRAQIPIQQPCSAKTAQSMAKTMARIIAKTIANTIEDERTSRENPQNVLRRGRRVGCTFRAGPLGHFTWPPECDTAICRARRRAFGNAQPPSAANSTPSPDASLGKTPAPAAGSAGSNGRAKSSSPHRTDSHAAGRDKKASSERSLAAGAKEKDLSFSHRTDSRPASTP